MNNGNDDPRMCLSSIKCIAMQLYKVLTIMSYKAVPVARSILKMIRVTSA